jgi:hypothetical protein
LSLSSFSLDVGMSPPNGSHEKSIVMQKININIFFISSMSLKNSSLRERDLSSMDILKTSA